MKDVDVNVVFDWKGETRKGATEGTVSVKVYEHKTRRRKYVSCGVRISADEWNDRLWVVRREDASQLNNKIKAQLEKCVERLREKNESECSVTDGKASGIVVNELPSVKSMKVDKNADSFLRFMYDEIKKADVAEGTRKHHVSTYNVLVEYGKIRKMEDVTRTNVLSWIEWQRKRKTVKLQDGKRVSVLISQGTVHKQWKVIKKYIGIAQAKGLLPMNVVAGISVPQGDAEPRVFLNDTEIKKWCSVELPNEHLKMARDRFIVQMGTGLAFGDLLDVDWSVREMVGKFLCINGRRLKTKKAFFCVILDFAAEVLERWGWEVPAISNTNYNIYLDEVAKRAGINKHITSHVGRHTYACYCLRHGVRIEAVQRTLGHSKIVTTQIYARLAGVDVVEAFESLK